MPISIRQFALKIFMVWTKVVDKGKIPYGKGEEFDVNGKKIAIFNKDGYYALDAMCAHQNNSIAWGEIGGDIVECPYHSWHYNIKTGDLQDYLKGIKQQTYKVEVRDDGIYIDI